MAKRGRVAIVGNRGEARRPSLLPRVAILMSSIQAWHSTDARGRMLQVTFNPRLLMGKEISVAGTMLYGATEAEAAEAMAAVEAGLRSGTLRPVVGKAYALGDVQQVHKDVIEQPGGAGGKLVLRPQQQEEAVP